ncbi:hypothetical protein IQ07DRAFT_657830 [Pyrenochaeta sp. DS3sAY3a]|nr:hypothetical protein IQ07DRAFT_657830 [Pyrenochaeta sp. DS3sAY3a]
MAPNGMFSAWHRSLFSAITHRYWVRRRHFIFGSIRHDKTGQDLEPYQLELVDSPVTQVHMHNINDGEATVMLGGAAKNIERVSPALKTMSR